MTLSDVSVIHSGSHCRLYHCPFSSCPAILSLCSLSMFKILMPHPLSLVSCLILGLHPTLPTSVFVVLSGLFLCHYCSSRTVGLFVLHHCLILVMMSLAFTISQCVYPRGLISFSVSTPCLALPCLALPFAPIS